MGQNRKSKTEKAKPKKQNRKSKTEKAKRKSKAKKQNRKSKTAKAKPKKQSEKEKAKAKKRKKKNSNKTKTSKQKHTSEKEKAKSKTKKQERQKQKRNENAEASYEVPRRLVFGAEVRGRTASGGYQIGGDSRFSCGSRPQARSGRLRGALVSRSLRQNTPWADGRESALEADQQGRESGCLWREE